MSNLIKPVTFFIIIIPYFCLKTCVASLGSLKHPTHRFNLSSTLEGALATLLYHILIAVFSVVGGYLGDAKIGRYKSIQVRCAIY